MKALVKTAFDFASQCESRELRFEGEELTVSQTSLTPRARTAVNSEAAEWFTEKANRPALGDAQPQFQVSVVIKPSMKGMITERMGACEDGDGFTDKIR